MKNFKLTIFLLIVLSFQLFGQSTYDFLRLDSSPRASALAGAYVAGSNDPNIIFYNPAGITNLEKTPVSFSFLKHLSDINTVSLASAFNIKGIGKFASSIKYVNYGTIDERDESGNKLGTFTSSDLAFTVTYGNSFNENIICGVSAKIIYSNIADYSSIGVASDLGVQYLLPKYGWNFGLSLMNIGQQITYYNSVKEPLPFSVQLGATKKLARMPLQIFFALTRLNDDDPLNFFNIGAEFTLSKVIQLRFGYENMKRKDYKITSVSALGGFSFGLGVNVKNYNIDYAFNSAGVIGAMHRIGITTTIE